MNKSNAIDRKRINTAEEHYWTETLGVSRHHLLDAVRHVGNEAADVRSYLATGSQPIRTV